MKKRSLQNLARIFSYHFIPLMRFTWSTTSEIGAILRGGGIFTRHIIDYLGQTNAAGCKESCRIA